MKTRGNVAFFAVGVVVALTVFLCSVFRQNSYNKWEIISATVIQIPKRQTHNCTTKVLQSGFHVATYNITELVVYSTGIEALITASSSIPLQVHSPTERF